MKVLHRRIVIGGVILLFAGLLWYLGTSFLFVGGVQRP
jgi:hypothetical protein